VAAHAHPDAARLDCPRGPLGCQATGSGPPWWGHTSPNGKGSRAPTIRPPKGHSGGHRLRPCHGFPSPPIPPQRGLCGGARRVRWVALLALQPGTASARCGGRPGPSSTPRPPGASAPAAPQGAPRRHKPQPGQAE
jgi:hypothetical protein